jgi:putative ABC transport system permease protein
MNVFSRGIRNAFRNVIRTFSIVVILGLSMGLALAMLVVHQAVGQKINSVKSAVGSTVSISPAGARGFEGGGTALTTDELVKVKAILHVKSVDESLSDRLTSTDTNLVSAVDAGTLGKRNAKNNGAGFDVLPGSGAGPRPNNAGNAANITRTFTPPVTLHGTTNPTNLSEVQGGGTFTLKSGKVFDGASSENVAMIGSTLAAKNNLSVGSTFTAYTTTISVVAIFDAGNTFTNNLLIMPLASMQAISGQPGTISSATVNVDSITNVDYVTTAAKATLGTAADVTNAAVTAKESIAPLENIQTISLYSLIGAVVAGSIIILLTMIMIVRERRREIGVIKAIGASNVKIITQFVTEAITLTLLGSVIGIFIGITAGNPITRLLVNNSSSTTTSATQGTVGPRVFGVRRGAFGAVRNNLTNIHSVIGWSIIIYGLAAAIIIAILGSITASFFISKVRPAEVMRTE